MLACEGEALTLSFLVARRLAVGWGEAVAVAKARVACTAGPAPHETRARRWRTKRSDSVAAM